MIFVLAIAAFLCINQSHMTYERLNSMKAEPIAYICYSGDCA